MAIFPVLVVDDDAVSRHVLCQALASADMPHVAVGSGSEALARVDELRPSLILLDLMMPQPDGYQVLRILRSRASTKDIPVVVLTAADADSEVSRAFEAGADDFVHKPFRRSELVARIKGQLRLRSAMDALERKERDAQLVLDLTQALASNLDFRSILFTVTQRIADVARVDRVSIVLVREPGDVGYVVAASDDEQLRDLPIDLAAYPEIREVLAQGQPLVIRDTATHPLLDLARRGDAHARAFTSLAILPILYEGKAMGVLFLRARHEFDFADRELALCRTVASAMAIALRNARVLQTLRDQTQQVNVARFEAERRLKSLQRYADFFESSADGIVVFDSEGHLLFSNPKAREITGYEEADLRGRTLRDVLGEPEDRGRELREGFLRGEFPRGIDVHIRRRDGERVVLSLSFSSVVGAEGVVLCSFRDVTAQRALESELVKTKSFLERLIDASADAIIAADLSGRVLIFNRAAEVLSGRSAQEVIGSDVRVLYPEHGATKVMRLIRASRGRVDRARVEILGSDGELVPVALSATMLQDGGEPVGTVGVFTDLRDKMRMEAELQKAQEQLIAKERQAVIAELAGAAAHELNQPLTAVLMSAELLRRRLDASAPSARTVDVIRAEAERMAEIVKKIGKITRYETKAYVGRARILDLDRASDAAPGSSPPPSRPAGAAGEAESRGKREPGSVERGSAPPRSG